MWSQKFDVLCYVWIFHGHTYTCMYMSHHGCCVQVFLSSFKSWTKMPTLFYEITCLFSSVLLSNKPTTYTCTIYRIWMNTDVNFFFYCCFFFLYMVADYLIFKIQTKIHCVCVVGKGYIYFSMGFVNCFWQTKHSCMLNYLKFQKYDIWLHQFNDGL